MTAPTRCFVFLLFFFWLPFASLRAAESSVAVVPDPQHTGTPFMRIWTAEEYGASPVNWHIQQNLANGFTYVANNFGVLEYDGAKWRLTELPNEGRARTLAIDRQGRVWAGGDDIMLLTPDRVGTLHAESQLGKLPGESRAVGNVVFSAVTSRGLAFASVQAVFFFPEQGPAIAVRPPANILGLWTDHDEAHVLLNNGAVLKLQDAALVPADFTLTQADSSPAADAAGRWHFLMRRRVLAATPASPENSPAPPPLPPELFTTNRIVAATRLANGGIACATVRSGLLVFDAQGKKIRQIDRSHGLPGNRIDFIQEDSEGGLWLAMRTGLARVQLDSPFAIHGTAQGLEGGPRTLLRHAGQLYVGHNEGLARVEADGRFRDLPGLTLGTNRLVAHQGRLFVTSTSLREALPDGTLRPLTRQPFLPLIGATQDPRKIFGGMSTGVWLDEIDGDEIKTIGRIASVPGPISHLLDTGDQFVWATTPTGGVWRIDFRQGLTLDAPARNFGAAEGLRPARRRDEIVPFELGGEVVISSAQWLLRYDRAQDRLVPETRIAGLDAGKIGATDLSRDAQGNWWLRLGLPHRDIVQLVPNGVGRWQATPVTSRAVSGLLTNGLYADLPARTLWVAGQGALVSIALDWKSSRVTPPLRVYVRSVRSPDGTALIDPSSPADAELAAAHTSLRLEFAAPTFQPDYHGQTNVVYRTKLAGLDEHWTEWTEAAQRDFTNLPYRKFSFQVQARDLAGRVSEVASFAFKIAPPWWLTPAAQLGYLLLGALGIAGLVRLRTRALRRRGENLERTIAERTQELHARNLELARLHTLELDEKISAQLAEEKARLEVLRYQLNPHFLFNALNSVCAQIIREPVAARAMVVRLADFCRLTLHRPGSDEEAAMTIGQELKLLGAYLEIEQARLGELITVEIQADPSATDVRIPPFLLLPLVENAVKYGAATSPEQLALKLTIRHEAGDVVEIEIANTGEWLEPGAHSAPSHGIGLENLRQRLARYYPRAHEFTIVAGGGWVIMRLRLLAPLHAHPRPAH